MNRPSVIVVLLLAAFPGACSSPDISINNAWVRTPQPTQSMAAGYLVLKNNTTETITLVSVSSDIFTDVSIHQSRLSDGIWKMIPIPELQIDAKSEIRLQPGGYHLMMSNAQHAVKQGDSIVFDMHFADGRLVTVPALVQDAAP